MKIVYGLLFLFISNILAAQEHSSNNTLLLRQPDVLDNTLVFTYGQQIWKTQLNSLAAQRITSFQGQTSHPKLSPDGNWIAFTGQYNGNRDVFIVNVSGGTPKQLTWHPGDDVVNGWSKDSKFVTFSSGRDHAPRGQSRLYKVALTGNTPTDLPMIRADKGSYSEDGTQFVYQKVQQWDDGWRKYRGGQNNPLRIVNLTTLQEQKLPFSGEKIVKPNWIGENIYYLSDIDDVMNVFSYNIKSKKTNKITNHDDYDVKDFSADGSNVVYEQQGRFFLVKDGTASQLNIRIQSDFPWTIPQWKNVNKSIESIALSANGKRAMFTARGDVFTVPVKHGDTRNISNSAAREVAATWSPDGKSIAWFSDASGEYRIVIANQYGKILQDIKLREQGFYRNLTWSSNSEMLTYTDEKQQFWYVKLNNGKNIKIDQDFIVTYAESQAPKFSPDDRYIAYIKNETNFYGNVYIYSIKDKTSYLVTDNMADNRSFEWDINGKYLYVTGSVNYASKAPWLDLSIVGKSLESYEIYALLLNNQVESPTPFKQDDESPDNENESEESEDDTEDEAVVVNIDFKNINTRMLPISLPAGYYSQLTSVKDGLLYVHSKASEEQSLHLFDFNKQESSEISAKIKSYTVAANKQHILVQNDSTYFIAEKPSAIKDAKALNVDLNVWLEPKQEWQQIFREAWRFQRDYFYVTNIHGANWQQVYKDYSPLIEHINHPSDLTYLLDELGAETSVGHSFTSSGDLPSLPKTNVGLLGADISIVKGQFVINKIYDGENWNAELTASAPLAPYQHKVSIGDAIIKVDDQSLAIKQNFYQYFNGTVNKQTKLTIAKQGNTKQTFDIWVKPTDDEYMLRMHAWIENNRRYVDKASNNQLAYVWVPDTSDNGYNYFNRYFFAQSDKQGAIIDERFNHGGSIADYFIDILNRKLSGYFNNTLKPNQPLTSPGAFIEGPKIMLVNEMSGSGGDMFPYLFRFHKIGTLVGTKTWGGLVGTWGVPSLVDGGHITAPRSGFYDLNGEYKIENEGVAPDITVEEDLILAKQGIDSQLKAAVELAVKQLEQFKEQTKRPAPKDPVRALTAVK